MCRSQLIHVQLVHEYFVPVNVMENHICSQPFSFFLNQALKCQWKEMEPITGPHDVKQL